MNLKDYTKEQLIELGKELNTQDASITNYLLDTGCEFGSEEFETKFKLLHTYEQAKREALSCSTCKRADTCKMYKVWKDIEFEQCGFPEVDFSCRHHISTTD